MRPCLPSFRRLALSLGAVLATALPAQAAPERGGPSSLGAFERGEALAAGEKYLGLSAGLTPLLIVDTASAGLHAALGTPIGEFRVGGALGGMAILAIPVGFLAEGTGVLAAGWKGQLFRTPGAALSLKLQTATGTTLLPMPAVATLSAPFDVALGGWRLLAEPGVMADLTRVPKLYDTSGHWPVYAHLGAETRPWPGLSLSFGARVQPGALTPLTLLPTVGLRWAAGPVTYDLSLLDLYPSDLTRAGRAGLLALSASLAL